MHLHEEALRSWARAHNGLGAALLAAGLPGQARAQHEAALTLASESGDRYEQARARDGIAAAADRSTSPLVGARVSTG